MTLRYPSFMLKGQDIVGKGSRNNTCFFVAHIRECDGAIQTLDSHSEGVAQMAGEFASAFGAGEWGRLAGEWHDLGKYSEAFQAYIRACTNEEANAETLPGKVDHSSAGAQYAVQVFPLIGHLLAYPISGHHSGLLDALTTGACLDNRLKKKIPELPFLPQTPSRQPPLPDFLKIQVGCHDGFGIAFFLRMLFSCLCDADYLDTERFMQPTQSAQRPRFPFDLFQRMADKIDAYIKTLPAASGKVNCARVTVRSQCAAQAAQSPGFFSLTVPTGGGKTLSSLTFALRHAQKHGLDRIVYVVPFTTIIEQNADVFRKALRGLEGVSPDQMVIEHHCNFDPDKETPAVRLACENWDAKLIVTTSVQFYESLFSSRPSACRKIHNLARSVVVLDEAQSIPVDYLHPCIRALRELVEHYGASVVFCTATQPAIYGRDEFPIGIEKSKITEIIQSPVALYQDLKRVKVTNLGTQTDVELLNRLQQEQQALCIVKTTGHAAKLAQAMEHDESAFHLSARMCPAHRCAVLDRICDRLAKGLPCRAVSTTLVEAGVDIDFPVVFRALSGIDSVAQAAGRCNRNGKLAAGRVYVFEPEHAVDLRFMSEETDCGKQIFALYGNDPLGLAAIDHYFRLHFWQRQACWDKYAILERFKLVQDKSLPFLFDFATADKTFKLIPDETHPVIIPYGDEGYKLCEELRHIPVLTRSLARRAQRFTVSVRSNAWFEHLGRLFDPLFDNSMAVLCSPEINYSPQYGLHLDCPTMEGFFI